MSSSVICMNILIVCLCTARTWRHRCSGQHWAKLARRERSQEWLRLIEGREGRLRSVQARAVVEVVIVVIADRAAGICSEWCSRGRRDGVRGRGLFHRPCSGRWHAGASNSSRTKFSGRAKC